MVPSCEVTSRSGCVAFVLEPIVWLMCGRKFVLGVMEPCELVACDMLSLLCAKLELVVSPSINIKAHGPQPQNGHECT